MSRFNRVHLIAYGIGSVIGVVILTVFYSFNTASTSEVPEVFGKEDAFSCVYVPAPEIGGQVWSVMYSNGKIGRPWLRMVNSFGGDWNSEKRCEEITERLEKFRQGGLIGFSHRPDPNTPKQSVICAITKIDPRNCNILVTLKPGADGYNSLLDMTTALRTGGTVVQSSGGGSQPEKLSQVNVENFLAEDDLKVKAK
ncbi:MAG: hypothetical protein RLZZ507_2773 [Cyanobacteriota bacterium]